MFKSGSYIISDMFSASWHADCKDNCEVVDFSAHFCSAGLLPWCPCQWELTDVLLAQVISSMHQSGEAEVSCLLFYQYLASIVTIPLFTALFLHWI